MVRLAAQRDMPALVQLWQQVFGDDPPFIEKALSVFAGEGNVFVYEQAGALQAMLSAVPCTMRAAKGFYHFALGTAPAMRGQGLMARLMEEAEQIERQRGAAFAALIPASASLFGYYQKHGYQTLDMRYWHLCANDLPKYDVEPKETWKTAPVAAVDLKELRRELARTPYIDFTPERYEMIQSDLEDQGGFVLSGPSGYAVYFVKGETLAVAEMSAWSTRQGYPMLWHMAQKTGCRNITVTLAPYSMVFDGMGERKPAAQIKPLTPTFCGDEVYLRFGIDPVFDKDYESVVI